MTSFNWIILMEKFAGRVLGKLSGTSLPERGLRIRYHSVAWSSSVAIPRVLDGQG